MSVLLQTQGIHHITLNGADRKTSIDFWQEILGMKLIFEHPNLDDLSINLLYFDCGDGVVAKEAGAATAAQWTMAVASSPSRQQRRQRRRQAPPARRRQRRQGQPRWSGPARLQSSAEAGPAPW